MLIQDSSRADIRQLKLPCQSDVLKPSPHCRRRHDSSGAHGCVSRSATTLQIHAQRSPNGIRLGPQYRKLVNPKTSTLQLKSNQHLEPSTLGTHILTTTSVEWHGGGFIRFLKLWSTACCTAIDGFEPKRLGATMLMSEWDRYGLWHGPWRWRDHPSRHAPRSSKSLKVLKVGSLNHIWFLIMISETYLNQGRLGRSGPASIQTRLQLALRRSHREGSCDLCRMHFEHLHHQAGIPKSQTCTARMTNLMSPNYGQSLEISKELIL